MIQDDKDLELFEKRYIGYSLPLYKEQISRDGTEGIRKFCHDLIVMGYDREFLENIKKFFRFT